ncbi:MAG: hypothetical protein ABSG04_00100, partial [Verrucomicrobiota bacterium]
MILPSERNSTETEVFLSPFSPFSPVQTSSSSRIFHLSFPDPYGPINPHKYLILKPLQLASFLRIFPLTAAGFIVKILFSDDGKDTTGPDRGRRRRSAPARQSFGGRR